MNKPFENSQEVYVTYVVNMATDVASVSFLLLLCFVFVFDPFAKHFCRKNLQYNDRISFS